MTDYKQLVESKRQAMLDALLESIANNPTRWESGWVAIDVPFNGQTLKNYNGVNALFLDAVAGKRGYKDPRWVTFNQAKELGANVKAGEKSSEVFYWSKYDSKTKKPFDVRSIEGMTDDERKAYLKENVKSVLKFYQVFNAEQCDKFPENTRKETMTEAERKTQNTLIETVIKNSEAPVKYDGGDKAYYSPAEDEIHIPTVTSFKTMNDYYATTLHEIGHSTGHPNRLNRQTLEGMFFGTKEYAIEELRAELSSVFMQSELGIDLGSAEIANHGAYLHSWLEVCKSDPSAFYKAAADAGKIANYLKDRYIAAEQEQSKAAEVVVENTREKQYYAVREKELSSVTGDPDENLDGNAIYIIKDGVVHEDSAYSKGVDIDAYILNGQIQLPNREMGYERVSYEELEQKAQQVEQVQQVGLVSIEFAVENKLKEYGKATMFRIPKGVEFSSFVFLAPTKFVGITENGVTLKAPANFEFTLQNDGREVKLTGEELRAEFAGQKTGKSAQRISASKRNAARLDALRTNAPVEMREMTNWCVFRTKWNEEKGKKDKFVLSPIDGKWARSNAPESWTTFDKAVEYALDNNCEGLAFALDNSGISCIDLDKSIDAAGQLNGIAEKLSSELKDTYCEKSVSGNGLHFFVKDDILGDKYRNRVETPQGELEVYQTGRFISMTGNVVGKTEDLAKCPMATTTWLRKTLGAKSAESAVRRQQSQGAPSIRYQSDADVIERIRRSKKGSAFDTLYSGGSITGDKSRDDLAMLNTLAFFTDCNEAQMKSIFESSARFRPDTKNAAYLDRSIKKACDSLTVRFGERQNVNHNTKGK